MVTKKIVTREEFLDRVITMMKKRILLFGLLSLLSGSVPLTATTVFYDEAIDGDLSGDWQNPTSLVLDSGSLTINASLSGLTRDRDIFTISVLPGVTLTEVNILSYVDPRTPTIPTANISFLGLQPGSQLSQDPTILLDPVSPMADPINFVLFGQGNIGASFPLINSLVVGAPLRGLNPLPAGDYTFILNETGDPAEFSIEFVGVPEPSSVILLALGMCSLVRRKRL